MSAFIKRTRMVAIEFGARAMVSGLRRLIPGMFET